ncbi:sensor histidine kinase [Kordiimonas aquimaris]|uniref:sensor histidine kinase n=1 Tax=Kordiimonas aquimaris TaxID=707591 RepID=UPI0021CEF554|nr:histidine kinase [Kordiimonas aquimaris]
MRFPRYERSFWFSYSLAWLTFASGYAALHLLSENPSVVKAISISLRNIVPAALLGIAVIFYNNRVMQRFENRWVQLAIQAVSAFCYAGFWVLLVWLMGLSRMSLLKGTFFFFLPPIEAVHWHMLAGVLIYSTISGVQYAIAESQTKWAMLKNAEVQLALAKFDPHFLFNTLNGIRHLIRKDSAAAESAHVKLAELLRASLVAVQTGEDAVSLAYEMELSNLYLELQQLRFRDRLSIVRNIDKSALDVMVPPLILQPLLENAIRYGVEGSSQNSTLHLDVMDDLKHATIQVRNTITSQKDDEFDEREGMGLSIVKTRLKGFASDAHMKARTSDDGKCFTAIITVPHEC